jgi:phosphinothricin acetyltransferase
MKTRLATQSDLVAIVDIYNQTIESRMVTADTEAQSVESKQAWFDSHTENRPLFVMTENEQVVAWLSFKSFYGRPAYNGTVEIAIYVDSDQRGKNIGQQLLTFALSLSLDLEIKTLLAFIFSHNTPSMRLFSKNGFAVWGELPNVAKMDDNEYSLTILGKRVSD